MKIVNWFFPVDLIWIFWFFENYKLTSSLLLFGKSFCFLFWETISLFSLNFLSIIVLFLVFGNYKLISSPFLLLNYIFLTRVGILGFFLSLVWLIF